MSYHREVNQRGKGQAGFVSELPCSTGTPRCKAFTFLVVPVHLQLLLGVTGLSLPLPAPEKSR